MSKQLSLASINKQYEKEFGNQIKKTLKNGDFILIDSKFKETSAQELILDFEEILEQIKSRSTGLEVVGDLTCVYHMLILKHFTSLNSIIPNNIDKMVQICRKLINLKILDEIFESFPEEELSNLNSSIQQILDKAKLIGQQIGEVFAKATINEMNNTEK